jgi:AraC family transcriptional regulator
VDNVVLHASARRFSVAAFDGPLSIKGVLKGRVTWVVNGRPLVVDPSTFLVLNEGDPYSIEIDEVNQVETCCVFFRPGFVDRIARDMVTPLEACLDTPSGNGSRLHFTSRLHEAGATSVGHRLQSLESRCVASVCSSDLDGEFITLASMLLTLHADVAMQVCRVPAARASTRAELFRRLQIAREFLHGCVERSVSLEEVARTACLSPYHLHRAFRRTFNQTPHGYATHLKLRRAEYLLRHGATVTSAAFAVGFESVSSFTRLFSARMGVPPSARRRNSARSDKRGAHPDHIPMSQS